MPMCTVFIFTDIKLLTWLTLGAVNTKLYVF